MSDLIDREAAISAVNTAMFPSINAAKNVEKVLRAVPATPRWVRCEEPPKKGYQRAMVYSSETGDMVSGTWTEYGWMIPGPIGKITHWMPIEPPTEGNDA